MTRIFLDYCTINDALRDTSVLAKLRYMSNVGAELFTSTTVVGEAMDVLSEGPKEGQYMLVDLLRDIKVKLLHPRKEWLKAQIDLDRLFEETSANNVPASEKAHMAMAISNGVSVYVTSRPEAKTLSNIKGLEAFITILDVDKALDLFKSIKKNV
jgi:hypothetical protein